MEDRSSLAKHRRQTLGCYRYTRQRWRLFFTFVDWLGYMVVALARALASVFPAARGGSRSRLPSGTSPCRYGSPSENSPHRSRSASGTYRSLPPWEPRRILLIQLDHLGDAILTTAMLPPLRRRYPRATIEVLASPWNREVFENAPEVDRVHISRTNRFARHGRLGWPLAAVWWGLWLRRRRYDLAIDVRGEFPLALILWLSGARYRLGWNCGGGGFLLSGSPRYVAGRPEVESRLALLAELGIRPAAGESWQPRFAVDDQARRAAALKWASFPGNCEGRARRIVLHIAAGTAAKRWPAEHWRELLEYLVSRGDVQVVLVGAAADRTVARHILGVRPRPQVADWTGRLSILELAAVLEQADLLVGADSGPAHLAAAVGTAVVALFSGTNSVRQWQPVGRRVAVVRNPVACSPCHRHECRVPGHPCMRGLTPAQVAEQVNRLLESGSPAPVVGTGPLGAPRVEVAKESAL